MKPGTLVMLGSGYSKPHRPVSGAIGEVQDTSGKNTLWQIEKGNVAVSFPRNPSVHVTGFWQYPTADLIPISGPDIDVSETNSVDKYVEDLV